MSLLSRLFGRQEKAAASHHPGTYGGGWVSFVREAFAGAWQKNIEVTVDRALSHATVFRCVSLISGDIAKLRIKLITKVGDIWDETSSSAYDHTLVAPNHYQNIQQFMETWIISKLVHGNTYVLKRYDKRNVVSGLYILDPTRTWPEVTPSGEVYYRVNTDNLSNIPDSLLVPAIDIIHDRWNCFFHPLVGISPIMAAGLSAAHGLEIQKNATNFFSNRSLPSGLLVAPGSVSEIAAQKLKQEWNENFRGDRVGGVAVLSNGMTYVPMSVTPHDSQIIDQFRMSAETIAGIFGVPSYKVGVGASPTYSNVAQMNDQYYSQCLHPHIEHAEKLIASGLFLPRNYGVEFDLTGLLRMDPETMVKSSSEAVKGGILSPNEARRKFNMPPVKGGETPYLQQQNFSLAALAERDTAALAGNSNLPPTRSEIAEALEDAAKRYA